MGSTGRPLEMSGSCRGDFRQPDGDAAGAPVAGGPGEAAGEGGTAAVAGHALRGFRGRDEVPAGQDVPVAANEAVAAVMAPGAAAVLVVDVAGVGVAEAVGERDAASAGEGGPGGRRQGEHLVIGMESGEVKRHVGAELGGDPAGELVELGVGVVLSRDQ